MSKNKIIKFNVHFIVLQFLEKDYLQRKSNVYLSTNFNRKIRAFIRIAPFKISIDSYLIALSAKENSYSCFNLSYKIQNKGLRIIQFTTHSFGHSGKV